MQILVVTSYEAGIEKAKELLYEKVDKKTVLFLSGGSTPKALYTKIADEKILKSAAVGMVDERYGKKFHPESNETMIRDSGLLEYLKNQQIPFFPIIDNVIARSEAPHQKSVQGEATKQPHASRKIASPRQGEARNDETREKAAEEYDKKVRDLFFQFPRSIAIMGIGQDGHTAGIVPVILGTVGTPESDSGRTSFARRTPNDHAFVTSYESNIMVPPERITMTFAGLSLIDYFIVLVFGKEKKKALKKLFEKGSVEEIPARFYMQEASEKTIIITDQQI